MISTLAAIQVLCDEIDREIRKPDAELSSTALAYLAKQLNEKARRVEISTGSLIGQSLRRADLKPLDGPKTK